MKKTISLFCALGLLLAVVHAQATTISLSYSDSYYVGLITDDIPSNPANETAYLGNLVTLSPGAVLTKIGTEFYSRVDSTLLTLPTITSSGTQLGDNISITTSGTYYILGKYDAFNAGAWVWLVNATAGDIINLPDVFPTSSHPQGYELSHSTIWSGSTPVPEPGTMVLLGAGMLGMAIFGKRRMSKE